MRGELNQFLHCMKSIRIRSIAGPHFPAIVLNTVTGQFPLDNHSQANPT